MLKGPQSLQSALTPLPNSPITAPASEPRMYGNSLPPPPPPP
jgi:hypothetical protein